MRVPLIQHDQKKKYRNSGGSSRRISVKFKVVGRLHVFVMFCVYSFIIRDLLFLPMWGSRRIIFMTTASVKGYVFFAMHAKYCMYSVLDIWCSTEGHLN